jgi:hypothetical protein
MAILNAGLVLIINEGPIDERLTIGRVRVIKPFDMDELITTFKKSCPSTKTDECYIFYDWLIDSGFVQQLDETDIVDVLIGSFGELRSSVLVR